MVFWQGEDGESSGDGSLEPGGQSCAMLRQVSTGDVSSASALLRFSVFQISRNWPPMRFRTALVGA